MLLATLLLQAGVDDVRNGEDAQVVRTPDGGDDGGAHADGGTDAGVPENGGLRRTMLSVLATTDTLPAAGVELFFGVPFGLVTSSTSVETFGLFFLPGVETSLTSIGIANCALCGARFAAGPSLRAGVLSRSSWTQLWFAGGSLLPGFAYVPSAPLLPGASWFELLVRFRLGVEVGGQSRLHASFFVDLPMATSPGAQVTRLGLAAGLSY
jgi:hypothetical protein